MTVSELMPLTDEMATSMSIQEPKTAACEWCGEPATLVDAKGEPHCESCAQHWHAFKLGESHMAGEFITAMITGVRGVGANDEEILTAVKRGLEGGEPRVGAMWAHMQARAAERGEDKECRAEAECWRDYFTPIEGMVA